MGRNFNDTLAAKVSGLISPDEALQELVGQDLVLLDRAVQPHGYRFKHALLHDAVYSSLLSSDAEIPALRRRRWIERAVSRTGIGNRGGTCPALHDCRRHSYGIEMVGTCRRESIRLICT